MLIDLTLRITPKMISDAEGNEKKALTGHLGTHFDVMNKEFPLSYTELKGIVFDVSQIIEQEIGVSDINIDAIGDAKFVALYSGMIERETYGTIAYFKEHPQLSHNLIEVLLEKKICIIGVDFAGLRRGLEHTPTDQYCADRGAFVVENMISLGTILKVNHKFIARTFPMNFCDMTGLPCRVIAVVEPEKGI